MRIIMIGAGNLATNLGIALAKSGHEILQVYSRTIESAEVLAHKIGCEATCQLSLLKEEADIYIISVKDKVLTELVPEVCLKHRQKLFIHTAGSVDISIFRGYAIHYGVLYPIQTFSKSRLVELTQVPCFVEANDPESEKLLISLASTISKQVYVLSSADRKFLHLAAVFCNNFVNHCYHIADKILQQHGLPFGVLLPLIDETAGKVHVLQPKEAQTGPAVRYDNNVIAAQKNLLAEHQQWAELYTLMSKDIHDMAQ